MLSVLALTMNGCGSQAKSSEQSEANFKSEQSEKIWLFHLGQPMDEVQSVLTEKGYVFETKSTNSSGSISSILDGNVVEYLGVEWSGFILLFEDNALCGVSLTHMDTCLDDLSKPDWNSVVSALDESYGEHKKKIEKESGTENTSMWEWHKGDIDVNFAVGMGGDLALLSIDIKD